MSGRLSARVWRISTTTSIARSPHGRRQERRNSCRASSDPSKPGPFQAIIVRRTTAISKTVQLICDIDPQTSDDIAYPYTRPHSQTTHTAKIFPNCGYNFKSFLSLKNLELDSVMVSIQGGAIPSHN